MTCCLAVHLSVPCYHNVRHQSSYYRVASSACNSDTPCDHWRALSGTRVCLMKDTQPLTRCRAGTERTTLTFGDLPSHVGINYGYGCRWIRRFIPERLTQIPDSRYCWVMTFVDWLCLQSKSMIPSKTPEDLVNSSILWSANRFGRCCLGI